MLSGCVRTSCDALWPPRPAQDLMMREDDVTTRKDTVMVKQAQEERQSAHRTQWAAQFAVASELCKRGFEVALTM